VIHNVDLMLAARVVHGDLSAYNILYWQGAITVIDFPQVVDPFANPAGRAIFERDIARVCGYFAGHGVDADAPALAAALWDEHVPADLWAQVPLVEEEVEIIGGEARRGGR
jgi:RIO kinase 1